MIKTVLITGASSGFGEAAARKFAGAGYAVILAARRVERLSRLADELAPALVHAGELDVCSAESVDAFFSGLPGQFRNIDVLVNNAGLALGIEPAHRTCFDDWETMVNTNITGLLRVTRAVLPGMMERNSGHIINIGSIAGSWPYPGGNTYGGTKAFVQQFSRGLRADLLGKHIRVSNIAPGMAETEFSQVRFKGDTQRADRVYEGAKPLSAEDVADIILWVTSVPPHVNINNLEVMPLCQAWGPLAVNRGMYDD